MTNRIIITPDSTIIATSDGVEQTEFLPDSISIVLEDGRMFNIEQIVDIINKVQKPKTPSKLTKFKTAFKQAMAELEAEGERKENSHA